MSLPFADHCQPLLDTPADVSDLLSFLRSRTESRRWKYVELRPLLPLDHALGLKADLREGASFCFHQLDLRPSTDELFRVFHKSCVQRKLQRAGREGLVIESGRSDSLLKNLYTLLLLTRRRHQLPPQPFVWFQNLTRGFGEDLVIWVASKDGQPVASILTLRYKKAVVYKYGCSDSRFHNLGGMPFLFWHAIQDAKAQGGEVFDFGRSELENSGLIAFKDHWGGSRSQLTYYRYARNSGAEGLQPFGMGLARRVFSSLPDFCLTAAGRLLYRHIG
ncbi:MAG TPA: GNAT family N-acetyltransferase [Terriglobales bacterium]